MAELTKSQIRHRKLKSETPKNRDDENIKLILKELTLIKKELRFLKKEISESGWIDYEDKYYSGDFVKVRYEDGTILSGYWNDLYHENIIQYQIIKKA